MMLMLTHIMVAIATIAVSFVAVYKAGTMGATKAIKQTWLGFAATAISGSGLVVIAPHTLGHFCVLASAYVVGIVLVHLYARAKQPLEA